MERVGAVDCRPFFGSNGRWWFLDFQYFSLANPFGMPNIRMPSAHCLVDYEMLGDSNRLDPKLMKAELHSLPFSTSETTTSQEQTPESSHLRIWSTMLRPRILQLGSQTPCQGESFFKQTVALSYSITIKRLLIISARVVILWRGLLLRTRYAQVHHTPASQGQVRQKSISKAFEQLGSKAIRPCIFHGFPCAPSKPIVIENSMLFWLLSLFCWNCSASPGTRPAMNCWSPTTRPRRNWWGRRWLGDIFPMGPIHWWSLSHWCLMPQPIGACTFVRSMWTSIFLNVLNHEWCAQGWQCYFALAVWHSGRRIRVFEEKIEVTMKSCCVTCGQYNSLNIFSTLFPTGGYPWFTPRTGEAGHTKIANCCAMHTLNSDMSAGKQMSHMFAVGLLNYWRCLTLPNTENSMRKLKMLGQASLKDLDLDAILEVEVFKPLHEECCEADRHQLPCCEAAWWQL